MSAISASLAAAPNNFSTTLSGGIADNALSVPLNSVAGLPTEGVGVIFTKDTNGAVNAGSVEIIHWTGIGGSSLTLTNTGDRGLTGSDAGAQAYSSGAYFEVWVTSYYYQSILDGIAGVVTLTGSETLTNKTFTKPTINAQVIGSQSYTPGVAGTATCDLSLANKHDVTMPAGNITVALSNVTTGQIFMISLTQDGGGSRTVTWFTTIKWAGGSAPTLTTTANKRDVFGFVCTGTNTYDGYVIGQNI